MKPGAKSFFKCYPSDILNGISLLKPAERGIYLTILFLLYDSGGSINYDLKVISRRCNTRPKFCQTVIERLIACEKLVEDRGKLTNFRVIKELETIPKRSENDSKTTPKRSELSEKPNDFNAGLKKTGSIPDTRYQNKPFLFLRGHDLSTKKAARQFVWTRGVDIILAHSNFSQQSARSFIGGLLKRVKDDEKMVANLLISVAELGPDNIFDWLSREVAKKNTPVDKNGKPVPWIAVDCDDKRYRSLSERYRRERGKYPFQYGLKSWFPKVWVDEAS